MNVKFHKNCENAGKSLKISCERCNFVKFDIYFGVKSLILFILFYFIILPHTMNYKQNKNDNK